MLTGRAGTPARLLRCHWAFLRKHPGCLPLRQLGLPREEAEVGVSTQGGSGVPGEEFWRISDSAENNTHHSP